MPLSSAYPLPLPSCSKQFNFCGFPSCSRTPPFICSALRLDEISEIVHNKVLICATVATAIGQFSKPFTSAFSGKGVDFRAAVRSGGMPSVHSASVVAAATAIGLERGFSDSVFGLSLVFAAIVMYDAQGVRKEVGTHAKVINSRMLRTQNNPISYLEGGDTVADDEFGSTSTGILEETTMPLLAIDEGSEALKSRVTMLSKQASSVNNPDGIGSNLTNDGEGLEYPNKYVMLKESVGHTEIEVLVGAVLGFLLAVGLDVIL